MHLFSEALECAGVGPTVRPTPSLSVKCIVLPLCMKYATQIKFDLILPQEHNALGLFCSQMELVFY